MLECTSEITIVEFSQTSLKNHRGGSTTSPRWPHFGPQLSLDVRPMNIANTGRRQAALSESDAQLNVLDSVPNTQYPVHVLVDRSRDNGSPYISRLHCILTHPHS